MFTWYAAVVAAFVVSVPLMIKTTRAAIESVDPELINASYTLGRSERETVFSVILPLARKGMIAGLTLAFARALGEFGATIMLAGNIPGRTNTMPLEIYNQVVGGEWGSATGMVVLFTVISGGCIYLANKFGRSVIGVSGLAVRLRKQVSGFDLDVDWVIGDELAVLFGFSGSGKSMTMRMIVGLLEPDTGRIECDGERLYDSDTSYALSVQERGFGYVGQDVALVSPHDRERQHRLRIEGHAAGGA